MRALPGIRSGAATSDWTSRLFWILVWVAVLAFFAPRFVVGDEIRRVWRTDFESALREAEEKKLPLLVHFYSDWCVPCQKMESTVFSTAPVRDLLSTRFVAVKLNTEKNQHLVHRYGFEIVPTDLIIDPTTGRVLQMHSGIMDQSKYMTMAQQAEATFLKAHPAKPASETTTATEVASTKVEAQLGNPQHVVGLDGFSPVALMKSRKWTRGSAQFSWDHKGVTYYMTSRDEMIEFRKNPDSYAPKMLGCDPVILWETDRAVAGSVDYAAFFDDDLYLFKSEERRKQFKANPAKFTKLQHALKATQIERTVLK